MDTMTYTARREFYAKTIRNRTKTLVSAMDIARAIMSSKDEADAAAEAMNALSDEFAALDKEKRKASGLYDAIRAVYKDTSTACSHERANLKRELNDPAAETAALHARFPFRIKAIKGCYVVMTAAEYDALTENRRKKGMDGGAGEGDGDGSDVGGATGKNADKAAQAIAALELALAEMTADRDQWRTRATLAEQIIADAKKTPAAKKKTAKTAKAA